MLEIKLYAYSVSNYNWESVDILKFPLHSGFFDPRYNLRTGYDYQTLARINAEYNLTGRKLYGSHNGELTYTIITGIFDLGGMGHLNISDWSNQVPDESSFVTNTGRKVTKFLQEVEAISVSDFLVEDDLSINLKLETNLKFDLEGSFGAISLVESDQLNEFMGKYWRGYDEDYNRFVFGVELLNNGVSEYWACAKVEDILFDEINRVYKIQSYDWVRFILDTIGTNLCPVPEDFGFFTLLDILTKIFNIFTEDNGVIIDVGTMSQQLNKEQYKSFYTGDTFTVGEFLLFEELCTIEMLVAELQKHYGAFLYYANKNNLIFINRNKTLSESTIDDIIIEDTFNKGFKVMDYDRILLNVSGDWNHNGTVWTRWEGWAFAYTENGEFRVETGIDEYKANGKKYLDLRHKFYGYNMFKYVFFPKREPEEVYNDYKELLNFRETYSCRVNTTNISLSTKILFRGSEYSVIGVKKDYISGTSEIEIMRLV